MEYAKIWIARIIIPHSIVLYPMRLVIRLYEARDDGVPQVMA